MKYQVIHKLTNKAVRNTKNLEILVFDSKEDAQKVADMKNKVMAADFYTIIEVQ